jgi:cation:H+ antiporter
VPRGALAKLALVFIIPIPALCIRFAGIELDPVYTALIFGAAVVGAAILLAWAAEAAQMDISGSLAIALLALIAVLPEYAVDLYFAYTAGHEPEYAQYAAANMTGSNRLLIGLGWPMVALAAGLGLRRLRRRHRRAGTHAHSVGAIIEGGGGITLLARRRIELFFLAVAAVYAFIIPMTRRIGVPEGMFLLVLYGLYLWRVAKEEQSEPELVGVCAHIGALPRAGRRSLVIGMFVAAATFVVVSAEPFADALVRAGAQLGIDEFLLVQWLAPLVSESPELIVACMLAYRLKADDAIGTLLSSKVNQWTLLVGSIPLAFMAGGGSAWGIALDARQTEEFLLTASQTVLGFAVMANLRFRTREAVALLVLFVLQFPFPQTSVRIGFSIAYIAMALVLLYFQRSCLKPIFTDVFKSKKRESAK